MPSAEQARAQRDAAEDEAYLLRLVENQQLRLLFSELAMLARAGVTPHSEARPA